MRKIITFVIVATLAIFSVAVKEGMAAQLSKETQLKLLRLEEAKVSLQSDQDQYDEKMGELKNLQELFEDDVVTGKEVRDAEAEVKNAERRLELSRIDLAKTALSFLQESTHISIMDAYQYIDTENNRHMSITLKNDSDLQLALVGLGDGIPEAGIKKENVSALLNIENLYVSIKVGATVIGDPFEIKVEKFPLDKSVTLDFKLNSAADDVTVSLKYHNTEETRNIYLAKKSTEDIVRVSSLQFAQEGQMGNSVTYGIELERLAENDATFTLAVLNLPDKYNYKFLDKGNQLSRVKFSQGVTKHSIELKVNVPMNLPAEELKFPVPFYVAVGEDEPLQKLVDFAQEVLVSPEDFDALKVGYERLELTPLGVAKLDISLKTLYHEIKTGDIIQSTLKVQNIGSVDLEKVKFSTEQPDDWKVTFDPESVDKISPDQDLEVKITLAPPPTVLVGAYEVKVEATTEYENTEYKTSQKNIRIQVDAQTNLGGNLMLVGGLILILIVVMVFVIKISRR